ncbi:isochorismatase family protein [bacterium]|nr:isochorismatase family protein [bacterium]
MHISRTLTASQVQLLVVDVQERLIVAIRDAQAICRQIERLIEAARILEIPIRATEQYPKGLGHTIEPIAARLPEPPVTKMRFSACVPELQEKLDPARAVVLVGIETHVCISQTASELISAGFRVLLPRDGVGSRNQIDHETALARMAGFGVTVTTCEALLFEWIASAEHTNFKAISKLVKEFDA